MDLDQDGLKDIITGSAYGGKLHFFKGDGKGGFEAERLLTDESGEPLNGGSFVNMTPIDWDGDGTLDIVFYSSGKGVQIMLGKGDLRYGTPEPLPAGGETLNKLHQIQDARLVFYDWDADGVPDLIFSNGNGSIWLYRGSRDAQGRMALDKGTQWFDNFDNGTLETLDYEKALFGNPRPGARPTISVTDWNGDGKPDLLIGDLFSKPAPPEIDEKARQVRKELEVAYAQQPKVRAEILGKIFQIKDMPPKPEGDFTGEERKVVYPLLMQMLSAHPVQMKTQRLQAEFDILRPHLGKRAGYVWLLLQK